MTWQWCPNCLVRTYHRPENGKLICTECLGNEQTDHVKDIIGNGDVRYELVPEDIYH